MEIAKNIGPSTSNNPDLDWSQIRETVLMLNLAVAQIENALRCGDESVNTLAGSFTTMVEHVQAIGVANSELPACEQTQLIEKKCSVVTEKMHSAIVAFQFYDKLVQRLGHLSSSLGALSGLVSDTQRLYNPSQWRELQDKIKSGYTINTDKAMFDAILHGYSVEEALQQSQLASNQQNDEQDDVELF